MPHGERSNVGVSIAVVVRNVCCLPRQVLGLWDGHNPRHRWTHERRNTETDGSMGRESTSKESKCKQELRSGPLRRFTASHRPNAMPSGKCLRYIEGFDTYVGMSGRLCIKKRRQCVGRGEDTEAMERKVDTTKRCVTLNYVVPMNKYTTKVAKGRKMELVDGLES